MFNRRARSLSLLLVSLSTALYLYGCKNNSNNIVGAGVPATATISGTVVSSSSNTPVGGATVLLTYGSTRDSIVTNSDGSFQFTVQVPDTSQGLNVSLKVYETGYNTYSYSFNVKANQTVPVALSINSATYTILNGVVQDSTSQYPQGGASVIISLPSPSSSTLKYLGYKGAHIKSLSSIVIDSATTLQNGACVMDINLYNLSSLNATMVVSKAGFMTYQRNLILRRGTTQSIVVPLQQDKSQTVAHIVGQVTDQRSQMPITNASVLLTSSLKKDSTRTLNDGSYSFDINLPGAASSVSGTLLFRLSSYNDTTISFTAGAGQTVTENAALSTKPTVVGGDSSTGRGVARSISLVSISRQEISIHGVGSNETSVLVWQVLDSLGFPLDINHRDTVTFVPTGIPVTTGNPAYVTPTSGITDGAGQVSTTVNSGTVAGTIQLLARLMLKSGKLVESSPVVITVDGGLPDQAHFELNASEVNFAGYDWSERSPVPSPSFTAQAGDKYGNPVAPGTAIYFTTTGGIITAAGQTDATGHANATLYSGKPLPHTSGLDTTLYGSANDPLLPLLDGDHGFPADPTYFGNGTGYGYVKAFTQGENSAIVADSGLICFSAATGPILLDDSLAISPITIKLNTGSVNIPVHISDRFGNPLESGSTITTSVTIPPPPPGGGGNVYSVNATGLPSTLDDFLTRGYGKTDFTLTIGVAQTQGTATATPFAVTITVNGRNGTRQATVSGVAIP